MKQNKPKTTKTNPETKPKVFDVSKPGGSAPTASARPLIVTHRPMVQDPMMTAPPVDDPTTSAESAPEAPKSILKPQKIKLQPSPEAIQELAEQAAQEKETATASEPPANPTTTAAESSDPSNGPTDTLPEESPEPEPSSENDSAIPVSVAVKSATSPSPVAATPPSSSTSPSTTESPSSPSAKASAPDNGSKVSVTPPAKKEADAEPDRSEEYEQIIASRKYYVHIASPTKKRSMRLAVIGAILIILVAVACVDAMLDAGVLDISGVPHTNLIK